jgi:hypothetical protein
VRCKKSAPPPPANVPAYTYFQNLVIQAVHFSYPEAFALAGGKGGGGEGDFFHLTVRLADLISLYRPRSPGGVNCKICPPLKDKNKRGLRP